MPKRTNPFGDASPLQFKAHIGTKEVDLGVAQDQKMQIIYDKTKDMLFAGAKKPTSSKKLSMDVELPPKPIPGQLRLDVGGHVCNQQSVPMECGFGSGANGGDFRFEMNVDSLMNGFHNNNNCLAAPLTGQLQIDSSGQLCAGLKVPQPSPALPNSCQMCNSRVDMGHTACCFCERKLCYGCVRTCANCVGNYCALCSVTNNDFNEIMLDNSKLGYEGMTERAFCLHCTS